MSFFRSTIHLSIYLIVEKKFAINALTMNFAIISKQLKWFVLFFFTWNSLHERLQSHVESWSYKKKKMKIKSKQK